MLEGFKFISFVLITVSATSLFLTTAALANHWKVIDFGKNILFPIIGSAN